MPPLRELVQIWLQKLLQKLLPKQVQQAWL